MRIVQDKLSPEEQRARVRRRTQGMIFVVFVIVCMLLLVMIGVHSIRVRPMLDQDPYQQSDRPVSPENS